MEKKVGSINVTETDDGFKVEVTGKKLADMISGCCRPMVVRFGGSSENCCEPDSGCCDASEKEA